MNETEAVAELRKTATRELQRLDISPASPPTHVRLRLAMIAAERKAVDMSDRNEISDEVMRRLQSELHPEDVLFHQRYG